MRRWRHRMAPDPLTRKPKGLATFWGRAGGCSGRGGLGGCVYLWAMVHDEWGWAIGMGAMALVSYLITPAEFPPRYGLDHEFCVDDEEFLPTMAGATGVPFAPGNRIEILNNGDAFYPAMLEADRRAPSVDHDRGLHLLGRGDRPAVRRGAGGEEPRQACGSRSCSTRSAPRPSATEILETLERGRCQLAWYNPMRWYIARPLQPPHASQVAHHRRPDRVHRRRRDRRSLEGKCARIRRTGATCRSGSKGRR